MRPALSLQLYTLRDRLAADPAATLRDVAALGFTAVEPFALAELGPALAPLLAETQLSAPTAHASFIDADIEPVLRAAALTGTLTLYDPFVPEERWRDVDAIAATAAALNRAAARAADHGIAVGYHNHWWELEQLVDGAPALRVLVDHLDDAVQLEVDTYWAAVGGVDVVELLRDLGARVTAIHVKDGPISREPREQLPAGEGRMPLGDVLAAAPDARRVVEFDDFAGDLLAGIAAARAALVAIEGSEAPR
jgi:sugar phosphate isomerase/epimerase